MDVAPVKDESNRGIATKNNKGPPGVRGAPQYRPAISGEYWTFCPFGENGTFVESSKR